VYRHYQRTISCLLMRLLEIQTRNHCYTALLLGQDKALISGRSEYCPRPFVMTIVGSTWGSKLKLHPVSRRMHLQFLRPAYRKAIITSSIQEVRECLPA
jgi:hypothetical protein